MQPDSATFSESWRHLDFRTHHDAATHPSPDLISVHPEAAPTREDPMAPPHTSHWQNNKKAYLLPKTKLPFAPTFSTPLGFLHTPAPFAGRAWSDE
jgi:hypothetical protein